MSKKILAIARTLGSAAQRGLVGIGALFVFFLFAIVFGQVIARSLKSATPWAEEAAQFILICIVFLGAAAVQGRHGHVKVDFLLVRLPPKVQKVIRIVMNLCLVAALVALLTGVALLAPYVARLTTPGGGIPLWWMYLFVTVGLVWWLVLAFRALYVLVRYGVDQKGKQP